MLFKKLLILLILLTPIQTLKSDENDGSNQIFVDLQSSIHRGVEYVISLQGTDGSWGKKTATVFDPGSTAYHVYTLLTSKISDEALQEKARVSINAGFKYLEKEGYRPEKERLGYMVGFYLMALEARITQYDSLLNSVKPYFAHAQLPDKKKKSITKKTKKWMKNLLQQLLEWKISLEVGRLHPTDGTTGKYFKKKKMYAWGYTQKLDKTVDLSVSMIASLGIAAAHRCGLKVPNDVSWGLIHLGLAMQEPGNGEKITLRKIKKDKRKMTASNYRNEKIYGYGLVDKPGIEYQDDGEATPRGWGYSVEKSLINKGAPPFGSMATAGLTILLVGQMGLRDDPKYKSSYKKVVDNAFRDGVAYLSKQFTATVNYQAPHNFACWNIFYMYGLQRVGMMSNSENFGDNLWFIKSTQFLLSSQERAGSWHPVKPHYGHFDTAAALLFLNRVSKGVGYIKK